MRKLKLIWDFYGIDAEGTAKHHAIHLEEFAKKENISYRAGFKKESNDYSLAYIIVKEENMILVRDALIPQRGELYEGDI